MFLRWNSTYKTCKVINRHRGWETKSNGNVSQQSSVGGSMMTQELDDIPLCRWGVLPSNRMKANRIFISSEWMQQIRSNIALQMRWLDSGKMKRNNFAFGK